MRPWRMRIGVLLASMLVFSAAFAAPVLAQSSAQSKSGRGMNRQGGPGSHPGKGWKDPGQDQGSPNNKADPDCTGNRTSHPQPTNKGACDNPSGAADKPGGSGGFDTDKDWNNGCGNDTDFEDDNNGNCGGAKAKQPPGPHVEKPKPPKGPPGEQPKQPPGPHVEKPKPPKGPPGEQPKQPSVPPAVLGVQLPSPQITITRAAAAPPQPARALPVTGAGVIEMLLAGTTLITMGQVLVRRQRRR